MPAFPGSFLPDPCSSNSNLSDVWICAATRIELSQRRLTISIYGEGSCLPATLHILVSKKVRNKRLSEKYLWASWCLRMLNFWKGVQFEDTKALWESLLGPQSSTVPIRLSAALAQPEELKKRLVFLKLVGLLGLPALTATIWHFGKLFCDSSPTAYLFTKLLSECKVPVNQNLDWCMPFRTVQPENYIGVSSHTFYTPSRVWVSLQSVIFSRQSHWNRKREDLEALSPYLN